MQIYDLRGWCHQVAECFELAIPCGLKAHPFSLIFRPPELLLQLLLEFPLARARDLRGRPQAAGSRAKRRAASRLGRPARTAC